MLIWGALGLTTLVNCLHSSDSIRWPAGTYGIPKPASGCPWTDSFQWQEGWRSQDTNGKYSNNSRSSEFHLDGTVDNTKVNRSFCMKTRTLGDYPSWPQGQYCIYKSGSCPKSLSKPGFVFWDDENVDNSNSKGGKLPGGINKYMYDTEIRFCCQTQGKKNEPILLPTITPFFLLAYKSAKCQMVKWAIATLEWIYYDTEHDNNKDNRRLAYPYNAGKKHPTIYYCYYYGCNKTLTGLNGTFHSPNYPQKYPDGQYCSWRITVSPAQEIHLMFTDFSLQNENNTDGLYVYDGENATAEVLGVFYGGHRPSKEGIYSSSNHMFIIFKSDENVSYNGFSALYCEGKCPETAATTTKIPEMTSSSAFSLEKTTTNREPESTKGGAKKDQRGQTEGKGFDLVAVVVPVVVLVFLVSLILAGFLYYKRRRNKKESKKIPSVIYASPQTLSDNPCYDRSMAQPPPSVENPFYDRGFTIANRGCSAETNELYTELSLDTMDRRDKQPDNQYQSLRTPVYDTLEPGDAMCNPIYDSTT